MYQATHHSASKSTRHSRKAHKQHNAGLPGDTITTVAEVVGTQPALIDGVDDQHAQGAEDAGDPVDEVHVHVGAVEGGFAEDGCIDEDEEGDGELWHALVSWLFLLLWLFLRIVGELRCRGYLGTYKSAGEVDAETARVSAVQPLRLGEAEEAIARHCDVLECRRWQWCGRAV